MTFNSSNLVPWSLCNRWFNFLKLVRNLNIIVSHIFREGNQCADRLPNIGLTLDRFTLWNEVPHIISDSFLFNKLGKPFYRVVHSYRDFGLVPLLYFVDL
jgi:hypothetical protein